MCRSLFLFRRAQIASGMAEALMGLGPFPMGGADTRASVNWLTELRFERTRGLPSMAKLCDLTKF
jgi:hypothetical protein